MFPHLVFSERFNWPWLQAHLNLRDQYLPYKSLIAKVLLNKNPNVRTVINKIDNVDTASKYRTFKYELLAKDPDMNVELKEEDCIFRFDYFKVYWNSRLNTEHCCLIKMFKEEEAVCDIMAEVEPFAIPAGKKKVFMWANDLNSDSYASLKDGIHHNKVHMRNQNDEFRVSFTQLTLSQVSKFVRSFNEDDRTFIRSAAQQLLRTNVTVNVSLKPSHSSCQMTNSSSTPLTLPLIHQPAKILRKARTFSHYVMNLLASALSFLNAFIGLYCGHKDLFAPHTMFRLSMVHIHCFSTKSENNVKKKRKICKEISERIQFEVKPDDSKVKIWDVRDVAPQKRMYCASFRLLSEVAFK